MQGETLSRTRDAISPPSRMVAVQTSSLMSPEVKVFHTALSAAQSERQELEVLLLQGVGRPKENVPTLAEAFESIPGVTVQPIPMGRLGSGHAESVSQKGTKILDAVRLRLAQQRLIPSLKMFRPGVLYSAQQAWDTSVAVPLATALRIPRVVHLHYIVGPWLGARTLKSLLSADAVITVSDFIREEAIKHGCEPQRVHAVYNSVVVPPLPSPDQRERTRAAVRSELGLPADTILIGMVARLGRWKGQVELLEAAIPLLRARRDVALVFAGGEDSTGVGLNEELQRTATQSGVAVQVHLMGWRPDVPRLLDAFDIFAHPSRNEPFGLAVLEAMAHGLPVVAWKEGGIAYQVLDGDTGILCAPLAVAELERALERLVENADMRTQMGQRGRERAQDTFTPRKMAADFTAVIRMVAGQRGA